MTLTETLLWLCKIPSPIGEDEYDAPTFMRKQVNGSQPAPETPRTTR